MILFRLRWLISLALVLSATTASAQTVVFWPQPVPLVVGRLDPWPGGFVTLQSSPGVYISVQPDGRLETRTAVGGWELATRIGTSVLRFDGAGTPRFLFIQEPTPPPIVKPDPTIPPPNIRTEDRAQVDLRVTWWLTYFAHPEHHDWWMAAIFDELYHEGHAVGWTADLYWPGKMHDEYGKPLP